MNSSKKSILLRDWLPITTCLFLTGVAWGTLSTRVGSIESRMETYENQTLILLEELRRETAEIKLEQVRMASDIEWIKKEFAKPSDN